MEYQIRPNAADDAPIVHRYTDPTIFAAMVDVLAGRPGIAAYCLKDAHARFKRGRAERSYVATAKGSQGRFEFGRGFIIEVVR